jgi:hypothetical protein
MIASSQPLLKALRIVDGDESPAMHDIWAAMDVAKAHITEAVSKLSAAFLSASHY